jgi:hypothetical protein
MADELVKYDEGSVRAPISEEDRAALRRAVQLLENPAFVARLANWIGVPVEKLFKRLPEGAIKVVNQAVSSALRRCLDLATYRIEQKSSWFQSEFAAKAAVALTGAAGGAFGLGSLAVELPVTTAVMLRAIAEIARSEGEDVSSPEGSLACLEVFALGGRSSKDDQSEMGYFAVRAALAREVNEALRFFTRQSSRGVVAPAIVQFLEKIAARFGIVVSEKVAAQAVPVIGALGGATINALFMDHFQDTARGHFIVRRLERKYGKAAIRALYGAIAAELTAARVSA